MQFFGFLALTAVFFGVWDPRMKVMKKRNRCRLKIWYMYITALNMSAFLAVFLFPESCSFDMDNMSSFPSQNLICQGEFFHSHVARAFGEFTTHHSGTGVAGLHPGTPLKNEGL